MADKRRPRNIRDIAHLYLSRRSALLPHEVPRTLNVLVTSADRSCLAGFHVANVAAALATTGKRVRLFELSGLLPNASYYFAHSPEVYLQTNGAAPREFVSGLGAISVSFHPTRLMSANGGQPDAPINLVHLPPVEHRDRFQRAVEAVGGKVGDERYGLYLAGKSPAPDPGARAFECMTWFYLWLTEAGEEPSGNRRSLGVLSRWERNVAERVPVVFRNPNDGFARAYQTVCESLLSQINTLRRRGGYDSTPTGPVEAALRGDQRSVGRGAV